jgi:hypothetical protein
MTPNFIKIGPALSALLYDETNRVCGIQNVLNLPKKI